MNHRNSERGSIHVIVTVVLVAALIGTLGFIIWQNYLAPKDDSEDKTATSKVEEKQSDKKSGETADEESHVAHDMKKEIAASMNNNYQGLSGHMTNVVSGAISHTEAIYMNKSNTEMVGLIQDYFGGSNPNLAVSGGWNFTDFRNLKNEKMLAQAKASQFFDFNGSYIGITKTQSGDEVFIAFTLNAEERITYAFWGMVLGY